MSRLFNDIIYYINSPFVLYVLVGSSRCSSKSLQKESRPLRLWTRPYDYVCIYIYIYINPSKKVWKSEFVHQLLSYLTNIWRIIGIIIKIVELSLKLYPTYYDYLWHGSAMLKNVGQGYRWKAAKCLKFRKSFTVWKSEFNHVLLVYSSKSQKMLKTIIKIVKLSLKWYFTCYDYILYGSTVLWKMKESKIGKLTSDSRLNRPAENKWHNAIQ